MMERLYLEEKLVIGDTVNSALRRNRMPMCSTEKQQFALIYTRSQANRGPFKKSEQAPALLSSQKSSC